ncbi:MAG: hypothetical protein HY261_09970 [Chloroflexi bacterium]|nr:hypothetical protein [Chloroflexota bacterium]
MFSPIRRRLLAWNTFVLVILLVALGVVIYFITARTLNNEVNRSLRQNANDTMRTLASTPGFPFVIPRNGYAGDVFFLSIDPSGQVANDPQGLSVTQSPDPNGVQRALAGRQVIDTVKINGQNVRVLSAPVATRSGVLLGVLQVGRSVEAEEHTLHRLVLILAASEAGALIVALAGGWFLADRALVPIRRTFERQRRFVSDASHELRTPLALIRSSGELLAKHGDQTVEQNRQLVDGIVAETAYLSDMVNGLLTLAQSDAGRLMLHKDLVDLGELARAAVLDAQPLAASRGLHLEASTVPGALVDGDAARLRQVLLQLLDNSIKYTPSGGAIRVAVSNKGMAELAVTDTGSGIAAEHLPHVFERFYRADETRGREAGGAGLGLSIAKALTDAHGGEISLESVPGSGTTVRVRLPLASGAEKLAGEPPRPDSAGDQRVIEPVQ